MWLTLLGTYELATFEFGGFNDDVVLQLDCDNQVMRAAYARILILSPLFLLLLLPLAVDA